jgi:molybdopterin molybdotransferase
MISAEQAIAKVTGEMRLLDAETVPLRSALGRVLAAAPAARTTHPPADVSAMDGYAVRMKDVGAVPVTLDQIGVAAAGSGFAGVLNSGQAVRIFTGAPLPEGADAIVIQEVTEKDATAVTVKESPAPGRFIRKAGMDFKKGDVLVPAGKVISSRDIGILAAMNVAEVSVRKRPRIAILATGDELVMPGESPGPGQIISSNSLAIAAYVRELGGEAVDLGIARDTMDSLREKLNGAKGTDMLVTIGGASVGDYDLVGKVLDEEGMKLEFHKVAMRPGKPLIFGRLGARYGFIPVLGLPGNPVSAGVTAVVILRPAMMVMLGLPGDRENPQTAKLGRDLGEGGRRQDYLRARLDIDGSGRRIATPFDAQDSAMTARFAEADCLVVRAPFAAPARAGENVVIIPLNGGIPGL